MNKKLLIVDDEKNIISALKRLFRREDIEIFTALSGKSGLEILEETKIGVILSDQMMPEMTGVDFLSQAREIQPDTIRIVLSGYTDLKTIVDSINKGSIWRYLTKPWDDELIRSSVFEAFEIYELKNTNKKLTEDLKQSNETLNIYNEVLETVIEEKTHSLEVYLKMLQISQDVLEQMNTAVIGIDETGLIVIANKTARLNLSIESKVLLGKNIKTILPNEFCDKLLDSHCATGETYEIESTANTTFKIDVTKLMPPATASGFILTLSVNQD